MSLLRDNMLLAKQAIKYVDKLGLTSVNVPFRLSYSKSPLSRFDCFMVKYMRSESNLSPQIVNPHLKKALDREKAAIGRKLHKDEFKAVVDPIVAGFRDVKAVRSEILEIIHSNTSKGEKKRLLTALMDRIGFDGDPYDINWFGRRTNKPDERRIRSARKAIKFKHGNCGEKSSIVATWLLEQTKNTKSIFWVSANSWDHAWVFMADAGSGLDEAMVEGQKFSSWPQDTVVVDGWTSDWYPVHHPHDPIKGTPYNPFQLYVRNKIREAQQDICCSEECRWPPRFAPAFKLAIAGQKNSTYENAPGYGEVMNLVDDTNSVEESLQENNEAT